MKPEKSYIEQYKIFFIYFKIKSLSFSPQDERALTEMRGTRGTGAPRGSGALRGCRAFRAPRAFRACLALRWAFDIFNIRIIILNNYLTILNNYLMILNIIIIIIILNNTCKCLLSGEVSIFSIFKCNIENISIFFFFFFQSSEFIIFSLQKICVKIEFQICEVKILSCEFKFHLWEIHREMI